MQSSEKATGAEPVVTAARGTGASSRGDKADVKIGKSDHRRSIAVRKRKVRTPDGRDARIRRVN